MKVLSFTLRKSESKAAKRNTFQQFVMQGVRRIVTSSRAEILSLKLRSNRQSKQNLFSTLKHDSLANKLTVVRRELNSLIKDQALVFAAQIFSRHLGIDDRQDASEICRSSLKHREFRHVLTKVLEESGNLENCAASYDRMLTARNSCSHPSLEPVNEGRADSLINSLERIGIDNLDGIFLKALKILKVRSKIASAARCPASRK